MIMQRAGKWLSVLLGLACAATLSITFAKSRTRPEITPHLILLTNAFPKFYDATARLSEAERIRRFREEFAALLPGFYGPRQRTEAVYDKQIAQSLRNFPGIRDRYAQVARDFPKAFEKGQRSFHAAFPDYRLDVPVYLLHSLGEMDGGTREIEGHTIAVFGADVIARIHEPNTIKPFLDHELFHLYHRRAFPECGWLWCAVWTEGLAVYAAAKLNPGATDADLLLTQPRAIRPEVEPRSKEAMCALRAKLNSTDEQDQARFFFGSADAGSLPPRSGYFLGYLLSSKIGAGLSLQQMAKLPPDKVRPLLFDAIASFGPCPT